MAGFKAASSPSMWATDLGSLPRKMTKLGYVFVRVGVSNWEGEHRMVAAQMLGRPLAEGETVHHKNGDKADNRPENLEIWGRCHPAGVRLGDVIECPHCGGELLL